MDPKPSLSQYFGGNEVPPASQFFDEIGTSPTDMIQSVYLGESDTRPSNPSGLFQQDMTTSFMDTDMSQEVSFTNVVPTVSSQAAIPASNLPDPSTFFDTLENTVDSQIGGEKNDTNVSGISEAIDGLGVMNQPLDKEAERRRDAWIPNEEAQKTLLKAQSSPKGSFFPEREVLTMPGLALEEELTDGLHEIAVKYLGVGSGPYSHLRADQVSRDEAGLRELLRTGFLRSAINLTTTLISAAGQGANRLNKPSKHTPRTLQIWLSRFAVMSRVKLYEPMIMEAEAFGDFSKPDMFYQFYPDLYENRTGSMVPFALRLLVAEMFMYVERPDVAMDNLFGMLNVIDQMIANLNECKTEDGTAFITPEDQAISLRFWIGRQTRVWHSIINCAIVMKDYRLATKIIKSMSENATVQQKRALTSALCRVSLLAGNVEAASEYCEKAKELRQQSICPTPDIREYIDLALIDIAHGRYQEAYNNFAKASDQEPTNIMVANNLSICLLYMGRLKDAINVLQKSIDSDPDRGLNEGLLINVCTLYELESSKTMEKKLHLLRMLCKQKSDSIPNVLECLKLA